LPASANTVSKSAKRNPNQTNNTGGLQLAGVQPDQTQHEQRPADWRDHVPDEQPESALPKARAQQGGEVDDDKESPGCSCR